MLCQDTYFLIVSDGEVFGIGRDLDAAKADAKANDVPESAYETHHVSALKAALADVHGSFEAFDDVDASDAMGLLAYAADDGVAVRLTGCSHALPVEGIAMVVEFTSAGACCFRKQGTTFERRVSASNFPSNFWVGEQIVHQESVGEALLAEWRRHEETYRIAQ